MDSELKQRFDALCGELGMSINTAINIFAKAVVRTRSIPFKIELEDSEARERFKKALSEIREECKNLPEMSLDEINAEIDAYRSSK